MKLIPSFVVALILATPFASRALDRVSVSASGVANNGDSYNGNISDDGDKIVFSSKSSTLVSGDGNGFDDVFVYIISTNTLSLISRSTAGNPANGHSRAPRISGNGQFVVYESGATDLVSGFVDGNGTSMFDEVPDIFVHDLNVGTTSLVSLSNTDSPSQKGCVAPAISFTGQYVVFQGGAGLANNTTADFPRQIYVRDLTNGSTTLVSVDVNGATGTSESARPSISADGNLIVFNTQADLLDGGDTNTKNSAPVTDVYLRDVSGMSTEIVSIGAASQQGDDTSWIASISGDGNLVAFTSEATNFASGGIEDRSKIFVRDRMASTTTRISTSRSGGDPDAFSDFPSFSSDGHYLVFQSGASDLLPPSVDTNSRTDIYHYDLDTTNLTRISVADSGTQGNFDSNGGAVSNTGLVVFNTRSVGFAPGDNDNFTDVFATFSRPQTGNVEMNAVLKKALQQKIKKLKKKQKALKKSGNTAKAKKFARKIKKLAKQVKLL